MGDSDFEELWTAITSKHYPIAARPEKSLELPISLPIGLVEIYRRCHGIKFFDAVNPPFFLVPPNQIQRTRIDLYGDDCDDDSWGPNQLYSLVKFDGGFLSIVRNEVQGHDAVVVDSFHENFADSTQFKIVATNDYELLTKILQSDGRLFFLNEGENDYGFWTRKD